MRVTLHAIREDSKRNNLCRVVYRGDVRSMVFINFGGLLVSENAETYYGMFNIAGIFYYLPM
ncbi:Hypothetical protein CulFRC11_1110 [Corynebacterium ramonii]|uniref:Uncharacterized protein n=1 Tax=Corynebacterium ramonii TaxID=3026968 RepID=A0ABN4EIF9_9CORY|nr:Hypothetical protein Cul210932_1142 [Corynebacterium ulcerans]AIU32687.1 Hypothetical protein CulFRC11_1110 [Corynebacterium ramonii FRC0011]